MAVTTAVCWGAFILVLFRIDPYTAGSIGLLLFFVALFFAIWGTLSLLGFVFRFIFLKDAIPFRFIGVSLRQAFWFAIISCLTLFLASQRLFTWWAGVLLVLGLAILEGFFLARSLEARYHHRKGLTDHE